MATKLGKQLLWGTSFISKQNLGVCRNLATSSVRQRNIRAGVPKLTTNRSKPLTYEEAQKPHLIGVTKGWNSINTSGLAGEDLKSSETAVEDVLIRKFMFGTWHRMFLSEVIIKRRHNLITLSGLVEQRTPPRKIYFLKGYTEQILSYMLKRPVRLEIQTVKSKKDVIYKWI